MFIFEGLLRSLHAKRTMFDLDTYELTGGDERAKGVNAKKGVKAQRV